MAQSNFDRLSEVLFAGDVRASDFKIMPGSDESLSRDEIALSILSSMERMGLVQDGNLVDKNNS